MAISDLSGVSDFFLFSGVFDLSGVSILVEKNPLKSIFFLLVDFSGYI